MNHPAYRIDGRDVTRETFYTIACDPARSVVVEACAGAGKTWMLVSRVLRALLDGVAPHEILAITFTRKAAGEMRERLGSWLRDFSARHATHERRVTELVQRGLPRERAEQLAPALATLHQGLLEAGRAVQIRTFHGWFTQLLRGAPLALLEEIGLRADAELIETPDDHLPFVWRRFHAAVRADAALRADHVEAIGSRGRSQLNRWLGAALDKRIEFELADAAGTLEPSVCAAADWWPELAGVGHPAALLLSDAAVARLRALAVALGQGKGRAPHAAAQLSDALVIDAAGPRFEAVWDALFTQRNKPRQLGDVPGIVDERTRLERLRAQVVQHEAHVEHHRLLRLARVLIAEYAAYKRERGLADMADLERCALALLRDASLAGWVQERLDARVRQVLIDEFQDTSPLQWQALQAWLAAYAGAGGGTSGQRPPGVFIVGDPKQSIYRFRGAEPGVFTAAGAFVAAALDGQRLACDHTRRNAPELLAALNPLFARAQAEGRYEGFREHTTEQASVPGGGLLRLPIVVRPPRRKAATPPAVPVWRDSLAVPRREPETVLREQEAALVADAIAALLARGEARPDEVFVLCRKRESLRLVAEALQARHVPHVASEDQALGDAVEVRDLVALLDAIASPDHALSLATALRSPLFGASDADLVALAEAAGRPVPWWPVLLGRTWSQPALDRARTLLAGWRDAAVQLPPHDLLDRIVAEGEVRERLAAAVPAHQRRAALAAVDALLAQALALDGARYATPYNFVRALKRRRIPVAAAAHPDAVQLLTVHGAKGLEARIVFVMDSAPEPQKAENATLLIDWPAEASAPRTCAFVYAETSCPASLVALLAAENAARRREEFNALYVAVTRAQERVIFSATEPNLPDTEPSWWERVQNLGPAFEAAPPPPTAPAAEARAVLPTLPRVEAPPRSAVAPAADDRAARLGQAVHRTLEWAAGAASDLPLANLAGAAAAEFAADAAAVEAIAQTILDSPACATFFRSGRIRWAGNEVALGEGGQAVRIDRLVQLDDGAWWVLDYKLNRDPSADPALLEQMRRYRRAVEQAQPGAVVRCAFVTGDGRLVLAD